MFKDRLEEPLTKFWLSWCVPEHESNRNYGLDSWRLLNDQTTEGLNSPAVLFTIRRERRFSSYYSYKLPTCSLPLFPFTIFLLLFSLFLSSFILSGHDFILFFLILSVIFCILLSSVLSFLTFFFHYFSVLFFHYILLSICLPYFFVFFPVLCFHLSVLFFLLFPLPFIHGYHCSNINVSNVGSNFVTKRSFPLSIISLASLFPPPTLMKICRN